MTENVKGGLIALKANVDNFQWRAKVNLDGDLTGARIGIIKAWATSEESFTYITDKNGKLFNKKGITFIDEQVDGDKREDILSVNHIADELLKGNIDFGYMMENALQDHKTDNCDICDDHDVWKGDKLTMAVTGLKFAAAGASGFFRKDRTALVKQMNVGIDAFVADKAKYCPLCRGYFPEENACKSHCIQCDAQCT